MRISRKSLSQPVASSVKVMGATYESIGTTYYRMTLGQIQNAYESGDPFIYYAILEDGFDAINIDALPGSAIIDDELFYCVSDGKSIDIDGEEVDPFLALQEYDPNDESNNLEDYCEDVDDEFILSNINLFAINRTSIVSNLDEAAKDALDREYKFTDLIKYYNDDIQ